MIENPKSEAELIGDGVKPPTDHNQLMSDISRHARDRTTTERHGAGVLTLVDWMPAEATGYVLANDEIAGPIAVSARRIAPMPARMFLRAEPVPFDSNSLGLSAVWVRPLAATNGIAPWRRGRLCILPDALIFLDEPDAELLDAMTAEVRVQTSVERTLVENVLARAAAEASELWCGLLYATLEATAWHHRVSGTVDHVGGRSLGGLIATLRGSVDYVDWYIGPNFGQDESILVLMSDLGWEPMPTGDPLFMNDGRNQPAPQERKDL